MIERADETLCPICGHTRSQVVDSRSEVDAHGVKHTRRRRRCLNGHRYTTMGTERVIGRYVQITTTCGVLTIST